MNIQKIHSTSLSGPQEKVWFSLRWNKYVPCYHQEIISSNCQNRGNIFYISGRTDTHAVQPLFWDIKGGREMITLMVEHTFFEKICKEYLQFSKTNKTKKSYERDILSIKHLSEYFSGKLLEEITARDLEQYKNRRRIKVMPATVNRELSCIKHMFNKAVQWGYLKKNPLQCVMKFKEPPARVRYLTEEEIERLENSCINHLRPIVVMALNTGMRKSEILNLKWSDIDMRNRLVIIRHTKNNEIKMVPINNTLYFHLVLLSPKPNGHYVFENKNGKPYTKIFKGFKAALRRAGISDFRFHDLRHTFASRLVMAGVDIRTVQELLGHKSLRMTMKYSHLSDKHLRDAVDKLTQEIAAKKMPGRRIELRTPGFSVRCSTN